MKLRMSPKVIEKKTELVEIPSSKMDIVTSALNSDKKVTQFIASYFSILHALDLIGDEFKLLESCNSPWPGVSGFVGLLKRGKNLLGCLLRRLSTSKELRPIWK